MKTLVLTSLLAAAVCSGFAQGVIEVGNHFGAAVFRAPIFGPDPSDLGLATVGQPATGAWPVGTTVYGGSRLQGTNFSFGFYASTSGITTDARALTLIATLPFNTTTSGAGFVQATTFNVDGVMAGNATTYQIRVWDNQGGTVGFDNSPYRGQSPLVNSAPLGGISSEGIFATPQTSSGWTSFNIYSNAIVTNPVITTALLNGSQLQLNWPTNSTGYALESTTSLAAPTWVMVTNMPAVIGNQFTLTVETAVGSRFYRLRKP